MLYDLLLLAVYYHVEQFTSFHVLHHNVYLAAVLQYFENLDDVWVSQLLQYLQLSRKVEFVS